MNNSNIAIQFFTDSERTQYSAQPVINGRMYWLPYQKSMKIAYKKATSWIRFVKRYGNHIPMII